MNPDLWHTPHRLHPFKQKDCCVSVEATREQWDEVMPFSDPPSEASWRLADFAAAVTFVVVVGLLFAGAL
jgi:hypothetical protein